jgi:hypothetical protein
MTLKSLDERIDAVLLDSNEPDPSLLAAQVDLTRTDRKALLEWGLLIRIDERVRVQRQRIWRRIDAAPPASSGGVNNEYAAAQAAQANMRERYEKERAVRERESNRLNEALRAAVDRFAAECRVEGVKIGLEQANTERVSIGGQWLLLGDCTPEQLRQLSGEYATRAAGNVVKGGYYSALADELDSRGFATVRDMSLEDAQS